MWRMVSFFGDATDVFRELNEKTIQYAKEKNIAFIWHPMPHFDVDEAAKELSISDAGLIDVEPYDEEIFCRMGRRCRLLVRFGVGYDKVNLADADKYGIAIARTSGANRTGVAEMALTHLLAAGRQLGVNRKIMESGVWVKKLSYELPGRKVGILGFGNVGATLAKYLEGFGCEIVAYDVCKDQEMARKLHVRFTDLDEIFTTCDAISVHLPYNRDTHHLIDAKRIGQMKRNAVISCTARGHIIDEDALYDALAEHRIAGAGLDVYSTEPYPADAKLLTLDNIVLTPHVASQTFESLWNTYKKAVDIVADFFEGKELEKADLLNPGYRKAYRVQ